jgi:hypothetical protein
MRPVRPPVRRAHQASILLAGLLAAACDGALSERIIAVQARGAVRVFLSIDTNLNGAFNPGVDTQVRDALVSLRAKGAAQDAAAARTDSAGFASLAVPVGRYRIIVAASVLGDTLNVISGSEEFTVASDTAQRIQRGVMLSFQIIAPTQARTFALGKKVWLTGIALNAPATFGDSTVHVADATAAIRVTRVRPSPVFAGDSIVFLGTRSSRDGQPTFEMQAFVIRSQANTVTADSLSTALAATADGGRRDARLVQVYNAVIGDTATAADGSRILRVSDGSGSLNVFLARTLNFTPLSQFAIGVRVDVTGLLVPDPTDFSRWLLKPRGRVDIIIKP